MAHFSIKLSPFPSSPVKEVLLGVASVLAEVVLGPFHHHSVGRLFLHGEVPLRQRAAHPHVHRKCSGTVIGILLDARKRQSKPAYREAQREFARAESVQHYRIIGGGVRAG